MAVLNNRGLWPYGAENCGPCLIERRAGIADDKRHQIASNQKRPGIKVWRLITREGTTISIGQLHQEKIWINSSQWS
jgi:hypothetical protein